MTLQELTPYLDDLEERVDEASESSLFLNWVEFTEGRWPEPLFIPCRSIASPPRLEWPTVVLNATFKDPALMLLHQLSLCSRVLASGTGELLCIRVNYGTPTLPSLFGAELFLMPEKMNTLPACRPLPGGLDGLLRRIEGGDPDLTMGLARAVAETGELFREVLRGRPRLARCIAIYHPDLQGPMDVCELLVGATLFTDLIDRPDDVHRALQSITRTYRAFLMRWQEIVPPTGKRAVHWNMLHRGRIMLRDDSATNLSPAMFDEFIKPYDEELLDTFGGGAMHFCGKGDQFIYAAATMKNLYAIHMSQPELNDVEKVCAQTIDRGINIIGLKREAGERLRASGRSLRGRIQCW